MASFCILFFFGFLFSVAAAQQSDNALRCKDHPAYYRGLKPVLISSWDYDISSPERQQFAYLHRYSGHVYAPVGDSSSDKYKGLDLFYMGESLRPSFRMTFQRPALVYMLVSVESSNFLPATDLTLRGWRSEGWVERVVGDNKITYGIHGPVSGKMPQYAFVFSKSTEDKEFVEIPQGRFVKARIMGIPVNGGFNILVAEADGSPSSPVGTFQGEPITANEKCPKNLHDVWVTEDDNKDDIDTRGVKFETWHPAWDPCFWCAYDHEHGSNPKKIMDYTPKFTYTSRKNNRQMESPRGFKGFVLRTGNYFVYFSLHVVQSDLSRVKTQFHTINFAVVDRHTKERLMDIQHKGDFGWTGVRLFDKKTFEPIDPTQKLIRDAQEPSGPVNFRSINVLDNPNGLFDKSRDPQELGQYEEWQTLPMCMKMKNRDALFAVILKTPNTGIKSLREQNVLDVLGRPEKSGLRQSSGLNRSLRFNKLEFGAEFCPDSGANGGSFYTDPFGTEIRSGPGRTAVRQFVKRGFRGTLDGRYEVVDLWSGLYEKDIRGFFADHGYGIDPSWN